MCRPRASELENVQLALPTSCVGWEDAGGESYSLSQADGYEEEATGVKRRRGGGSGRADPSSSAPGGSPNVDPGAHASSRVLE